MYKDIFLGSVLNIRNISGVVVSYAEIDHINLTNNYLNKGHEFRLVDNKGKECFLILFEYPIYFGNEFHYYSNMMLVEPYHQIKCYDSVHLDWGKEIIKKKIGFSNYADNQRFDFNYYYDKKNKNVYVERDLEEKIHIRLFGTFVDSQEVNIGQQLTSLPMPLKPYIEGEPIKQKPQNLFSSDDIYEIAINGDSYFVKNSSDYVQQNFMGYIGEQKLWRDFALQNSKTNEYCRLSVYKNKSILWKSTDNNEVNTLQLNQTFKDMVYDVKNNEKVEFEEYCLPNNEGFISLEKKSNNNDLKCYIGEEIPNKYIYPNFTKSTPIFKPTQIKPEFLLSFKDLSLHSKTSARPPFSDYTMLNPRKSKLPSWGKFLIIFFILYIIIYIIILLYYA
ncbi:MAG: hypothetical protein MJ211_04150 [Bacteroidales bacterium]|nr:hypothetical protein [Bacteroidales bacterium]